MKTSVILGTIALGAFVAGAVYLSNDPADPTSAPTQSEPEKMPAVEALQHDAGSQGTAPPPSGTDSRPAPYDPRLQALMVSPDNGLIDFVKGADGRVIAEIDRDPGSPGFKKPLREYTYSRDKVIGLTSYRYYGDRVEITRTAVAYKPDGTIDQYSQSMSTGE